MVIIFIKNVIKKLKSKTKGVKINGEKLHSIRFADNIAFVAENERDLNNMLTNLSIALKEPQLKINGMKIKILAVDKHGKDMKKTINLYDTTIIKVKSFYYLYQTHNVDKKKNSSSKVSLL